MIIKSFKDLTSEELYAILKARNEVFVLEQNVVRISAQAYLESFYNALGFKRVSDNHLEDGIAHLEMVYKRPSQ
ncbi:GNAT family N-acetyltransferase [Fusibacter sp. JL216-2]|uniref:GNAT family N-acetyltransferase n=1 Tax=Fusibacter sp. JL216-2 TaxID=3071453 RepID=UPI003D33D090